MQTCERRDVVDHPCFHGSARGRWGRVHLPVAAGCNVQCNFCNRLYDCVNESRPGVTARILEPDGAVEYLSRVLARRSDISVAGIAGPGDPLCNPGRTLATARSVHRAYPGLLICISTNGLNLVEHIDDLARAGVTHVTVTINAVDPSIGVRVYSWAMMENVIYRDIEAARLLITRQEDAITALKGRGLTVKINTVIIPGVNMDHITAIAERAAGLGADLMNCIPMIPVEDTPFSCLRPPTAHEIRQVRESASVHIRQMYHCQRCRADAVGLLCRDDASQ